MFEVPITKGDTVPYALTYKYKSANVRLLPASAGTGLKAGSSIRSVLELAGYANILSKMIGSNNKLNNALATIQALASYKHADYFSGLREVKEETPVAAAKAKEVGNSEGNVETANHSSKKPVTSSESPEKEAVASGEKKSAVKK
ncbi:MAG: hypothetical protein LBG59_09385 [Candidatus Peribacteria bacterium]|jgi:hypothetical protein|nr:hypothetical protein [Candidatus Peribacteria bacterium]